MKNVMAIIFVMLLGIEASAAVHAANALGTGVAMDSQDRPWAISVEPAGNASIISMAAVGDDSSVSKIQVNKQPEPVSADGENHPKLAFGPKDEMYVSWTSPTSDHYTGDIRFSRSLDSGKTWSAPTTVHKDRQLITHRFDSLAVDGKGRVWIVWIDKRDQLLAEKNHHEYAGAAIYYAYSTDRGAHWKGDFKLADHSCECCRIALAKDEKGRMVAFWRHVFDGNERDHALAVLEPTSKPVVHRATFDHWQIDACPHHGPSLAIDARGVKHAVWFSQVNGEGRAFYGQLHDDSPPTRVLELPRGASHPDVATSGSRVAIAWKRFDGSNSIVESRISNDGGTFVESGSVKTAADSDEPRLVSNSTATWLVWRHADGISHFVVENETKPIAQINTARPGTTLPNESKVKPFAIDTLQAIVQSQHGKPFWLVLWDLDCPYCMKSLANIARAQQRDPQLRVVTVATDSTDQADAIKTRLAQLGVRGDMYAFSSASSESLRYAIDPEWMGEKPRAYFYDTEAKRETFTGVLKDAQLTR
jgi:hypothetical protein